MSLIGDIHVKTFQVMTNSANSNPKKNIRVFPNIEFLVNTLADNLCQTIVNSFKNKKLFSLALSGGSTPRALYKRLSEPPFKNEIDWQSVLFLWGDERQVPPDSHESNYKMVHEEWLKKVNLKEKNILRIHGEANAVEEAFRYNKVLEQNLSKNTLGIPQVDTVLLGVGTDGHTASIFPGDEKLENSPPWCRVSRQPQTNQERITFTDSLINAASQVIFLACGREKAAIISKIISKHPEAESYPASWVQPSNKNLIWYLDQEAASLL
jgi:6-phosphogluconolactonase